MSSRDVPFVPAMRKTSIWPVIRIIGLVVLLVVAFFASLDIASMSPGQDNSTSKVVGYVALLFSAPLYLILGGIVSVLIAAFAGDQHYAMIESTFRICGMIWLLGKIVVYTQNVRRENDYWRKDFEDQLRMNARDARAREEQAQQTSDFERMNEPMLTLIKQLKESCEEPFGEAVHATQALSGSGYVSFNDALSADMTDICARLEYAAGRGQENLRLLFAATLRVLGSHQDKSLADIANEAIATAEVASELRLPILIAGLKIYDSHTGLNWSATAAKTYMSIITEAAALSDQRVAVQVLLNSYRAMLEPYVHSRKTNDGGGRSATRCNDCANGYRLLNLPSSASPTEINSARRALSEVLHPDQLGHKSEKARKAAERQLMAINSACDHLLSCQA